MKNIILILTIVVITTSCNSNNLNHPIEVIAPQERIKNFLGVKFSISKKNIENEFLITDSLLIENWSLSMYHFSSNDTGTLCKNRCVQGSIVINNENGNIFMIALEGDNDITHRIPPITQVGAAFYNNICQICTSVDVFKFHYQHCSNTITSIVNDLNYDLLNEFDRDFFVQLVDFCFIQPVAKFEGNELEMIEEVSKVRIDEIFNEHLAIIKNNYGPELHSIHSIDDFKSMIMRDDKPLLYVKKNRLRYMPNSTFIYFTINEKQLNNDIYSNFINRYNLGKPYFEINIYNCW